MDLKVVGLHGDDTLHPLLWLLPLSGVTGSGYCRWAFVVLIKHFGHFRVTAKGGLRFEHAELQCDIPDWY